VRPTFELQNAHVMVDSSFQPCVTGYFIYHASDLMTDGLPKAVPGEDYAVTKQKFLDEIYLAIGREIFEQLRKV